MGKASKRTVKFQRTKLKDVLERRKAHKNMPAVKRKKQEAMRDKKRGPPTRDAAAEDEVEDEAREGEEGDLDAELDAMDMDEFMSRFGDGMDEMDDGDDSDDGEVDDDGDDDEEEDAEEDLDDEDGDVTDDIDDEEPEDETELQGNRKKLSSAVQKHKAELEALREKDPEFFKYLEDNDNMLLDFDEDQEADQEEAGSGAEDDEAQDDEDDAPRAAPKGQLLTKEMLIEWNAQLETKKSMHALRRLLAAFRSACHMNDAASGDKQPAALPYHIETGSVFNRTIIMTMRHTVNIFDHVLPVAEARPGKPKPLPSTSERWDRIGPLVHSFLSNLIHFLKELTDPKLLHYVIKQSERTAPYVACFPRLSRKLIKILLNFWGGADESVRVVSFLWIRQLAILCPHPFADSCLKGAYACFVRNSKFTTAKSMPVVNFMLNCVVELYGLDPSATYQHAFINIRQMAIHLRNAMNAKSKESYRSIYNWQFLNCLRVWSAVISAYASDAASPLRPLLFPLVQIIGGAIRLVPAPRYFPFRFQCVQLLIDLSAATGAYVPVAPYLLEVLASAVVSGKQPRESSQKRVDLAFHVKVGNAYLKSRAFQDVTCEAAVELLTAHFASLARSIAFPELVIPTVVQLRRLAKSVKNVHLAKQAQTLLQKIELNRQWVERHRANVDYSPHDVDRTAAFLRNEKPTASPLGAYFASVEAVRRQRRAVLAGGGRRGHVDDDEDDDEDVGGSSDEEEEEEDGHVVKQKKRVADAEDADADDGKKKKAKRAKRKEEEEEEGDLDAEDVVEDFAFSSDEE